MSDAMDTKASNGVSVGHEIESCFETYIVVEPSTSYFINNVLGCIVNAILAILGTFLNGLVVLVFWKTPVLRTKIAYFSLMLLSCIDMCVAVIVHPLFLLNSVTEITQTSSCAYKMVYQTSAIILSGMSYFTFFVMNIERYLSICRPFFHRQNVTKRKCLELSAFLWIISIGTGIAPIFRIDIQLFITILGFLVLGGTFFIYASIYRVARKCRNLRQQSPFGQGAITFAFEPRDSNQPKKSLSLLHDLQLAKMYLIVVFSTIVLIMPKAVVLIAFSGRVNAVNGVVQAKIWTGTLLPMNSTINSLIFFWANIRLRKEGWKICKEIFCF